MILLNVSSHTHSSSSKPPPPHCLWLASFSDFSHLTSHDHALSYSLLPFNSAALGNGTAPQRCLRIPVYFFDSLSFVGPKPLYVSLVPFHVPPRKDLGYCPYVMAVRKSGSFLSRFPAFPRSTLFHIAFQFYPPLFSLVHQFSVAACHPCTSCASFF